MSNVEVVLVSGMSGAGKSTAMAVFENMGYYCIDNYPVALLEEFGDYLLNETLGSKIANKPWIDVSICSSTSI